MSATPLEVGHRMSDNDRLVLDSSFATWVAGRGAGLPEHLDPFTYYVVEQFLKPYDPNDDDIIYGITDGPDDGGVDAIYFILNRSGFVRDDTAVNFRDVTKVRIVIFQVKTGNEGFKTNE